MFVCTQTLGQLRMPCSVPERRPLFALPTMANQGQIQGLVRDTIDRLQNVDRLLHDRAQMVQCGQQQENQWPCSSNVDLDLSNFEHDLAFVSMFQNETEDLPDLMNCISAELSEPYSVYTYRYFIQNWPDLCFLAKCKKTREIVGAVVCKDDMDISSSPEMFRKGYIAMLAVNEVYRGKGLGSLLVRRALKALKDRGCREVLLETESNNRGSISLYESLGFMRDDRMHRYYLNGVDAYRLRFFFGDYVEMPDEKIPEFALAEAAEQE